MQPEFSNPDFVKHNSAAEIHQRMMSYFPEDIDDMPGGFPYDFTMPAALEKDEFINYHMVRALMIAFPQYAWDDWLDLHGAQVHIARHPPVYATGTITVTGSVGTVISKGMLFCTPAGDTEPSVEFTADEETTIGSDGIVDIKVTAVIAGTSSNVPSGTVTLMVKPNKDITSVINHDEISGGTERENDDDYFDRISVEYANQMTYLGNDMDYIRWAKEAGAGDCIVVPTANGPGTVKLVLIDPNGKPANKTLVESVYNHIVSPQNRMQRLLPTACAELICVPATTILVSYAVKGLIYDETTNIEQIKKDFTTAVSKIYEEAKHEDVLRYNDVRPILSGIAGVQDFDTFTMHGGTVNINLEKEEYPDTGTLDFS